VKRITRQTPLKKASRPEGVLIIGQLVAHLKPSFSILMHIGKASLGVVAQSGDRPGVG
jgi:hypothetical protein